MKNLINITTALFLFVQVISYGQSEPVKTATEKEDTQSKIDPQQLKNFVGTYFLEEANFDLEIVQEKDKMYIISPFSKDLLIQKNATTLREPTRGVDLEIIEGDNTALRYFQNGYKTTIKRVKSKK